MLNMSEAPKTNHALSTDGLQNVHFYDLQNLDYLAFLPFDFERPWWMWFQKRVVRPKFNINVLIHTL